MSNPLCQPINVSQVSLELNTHTPQPNAVSQKRVSLCFSANFKKRTQALSIQKNEMNQIFQRSQSFVQKQNINMKSFSPPFYPSKKNFQPLFGLLNHRLAKSNSNMDKFQVDVYSCNFNNKSIPLKDKKEEILDGYGTVSSQIFQESATDEKNIINGDQFIKTCPQFGKLQISKENTQRKFIQKKQIRPHSKRAATSHQERRNLVLKNENNFTNNKAKILFGNKKPLKATNIVSSQSEKKKSTQGRISTAPNSSSQLNSSQDIKKSFIQFTKNNNKTEYRLNCINMSQHFEGKLKQKNLGFPTCKKITMSSLNKYYELCIEEIKDKQLKKKQIQKQKQEVQSQMLTSKKSFYNDEKNFNEILKQINEQNQKFQRNKSSEQFNQYQNKKYMEKNSSSAMNKLSEYQQGKNPKFIISDGSIPLLTATKIERIHHHDQNMWIQIRNATEECERAGFSMCLKKQIMERARFSESFKKSTLKKSQNPQSQHISMRKMSKTNSMRYKNIQDGPLNAWDTPKNTIQFNNLHHNNQFQL